MQSDIHLAGPHHITLCGYHLDGTLSHGRWADATCPDCLRQYHRQCMEAWAQALNEGGNYMILDTDTGQLEPGTGNSVEVCELRIANIIHHSALRDGGADDTDTYYAPQYRILQAVKTVQPQTTRDVQVSLREVNDE